MNHIGERCQYGKAFHMLYIKIHLIITHISLAAYIYWKHFQILQSCVTIQQYVSPKNFAVLPEQNMENRMEFVRQVILHYLVVITLILVKFIYMQLICTNFFSCSNHRKLRRLLDTVSRGQISILLQAKWQYFKLWNRAMYNELPWFIRDPEC